MIDEILANARTVDEILSDMIEPIVGDTPVSVQLNAALNKMASKEEVEDMRIDINVLKKDMEKLMALLGDTSVSEQINMAISNIK